MYKLNVFLFCVWFVPSQKLVILSQTGVTCHAYEPTGTPTHHQPQMEPGLCAHPSAWPLVHHGPRGDSPSSSCSLPGWSQCLWQPQRQLTHLGCPQASHLAEEWWPSPSPTLEFNTIPIQSVWSPTGALMEPLLPALSKGGQVCVVINTNIIHLNWPTLSSQANFSPIRNEDTVNWTRTHRNCWVRPSNYLCNNDLQTLLQFSSCHLIFKHNASPQIRARLQHSVCAAQSHRLKESLVLSSIPGRAKVVFV